MPFVDYRRPAATLVRYAIAAAVLAIGFGVVAFTIQDVAGKVVFGLSAIALAGLSVILLVAARAFATGGRRSLKDIPPSAARTSLVNDPRFLLLGTFAFGAGALANGLAFTIGIARGHLDVATIGQAGLFAILGVAAWMYARRWRRAQQDRVPPSSGR